MMESRSMPSQLLRDDTLLPASLAEVVAWLRQQGAVVDRLGTDLFTIWDRGRHGLTWDDAWVSGFLDDLAERVEGDESQ